MASVSVDGHRVNYELTGPDGAPVIVFAHALGASLEMWREQIALLSGRYRCLAYDANGHGGSDAHDAAPVIASFADDLAGLLDALGIARAHIAGASLGGMTAQDFAARYPARVDHLILVGTTAKMPDATVWTDRVETVRRDGLDGLAKATVRPRWFTEPFAAGNPDRMAEFERRFVAARPDAYMLACRAIAAMDLSEAIAAIAAPTLILAADGDPATPPAMAEAIRQRIGDATLIVVPHAAHMMAVEQAEAISRWISTFLEG